MRRLSLLLAIAVLAAASLTGCAPKLIPGTDILDNEESREVIEVLSAYTSALEARNVDRILALASDSFFETSGTAAGDDDFDKAGLAERLQSWSVETKAVRAKVQVKHVSVQGDSANAAYFFDLSYQVPEADGKLVWKNESDAKQMTFRREDGTWKITSGI
ncbi:MAG TPA: hypothetical protein DFS52_06455 [Myxococcales bacterium]|nr:hypothetical protein [Myxococcales bacterium]